MLTRSSPDSPVDNPLIESPFNAQYAKGLGEFPADSNWDLLDHDHFAWLAGDHWSFLGTF